MDQYGMMVWCLGVLMVSFVAGYWYKKMILMEKSCNCRTSDEDESGGRRGSNIPKGSLGWPLIGETLDFIACGYTCTPVSFMDLRRNRYGKVFKTHILGTPIIVSTDPEVNKVVLQNHGATFVPAYPKSITELLGESSILQINGALHKRLHSLIGAFLRSPQLKARITRHIHRRVALSLASWTDAPLVYVQQETNKIAFEVLVKVLMSIDPGEDFDSLKAEFEEFIKGLICLPIKLPGMQLYKSLKAKEKLLKMVKKIVDERRKAMEKPGHDRGVVNDAVDALLLRDNGDPNHLSSDFISCNIIEMMIPGEETVPMAMTLAVKFLSDSPVALNLLVEENMKLKQHKTDSSADYAWTDYMSLSFTQNVISETLRMANIINGVWRKALKDVEIKGHMIPKGWCVLASFISVHMDQEHYENPYQFDPFRWEKAEGGVNNNNSFTPFGGGQRLCPGLELSRLEISIFLHHLVTTYRWVAEEDEVVHFPTVKMRRKLPITVTPLGRN